MATNPPPPVLADNLKRLVGVYSLGIGEAASVLGLSRQSVSEHRQPSWATVYRIAQTFEIDADDLTTRPFEECAGAYIADPERFKREDRVVLDHNPSDPPSRVRGHQVEGFTKAKKASNGAM